MNPNTGKPYENREVTLKQSLGRVELPAAGAVDTTDFYPVNTPTAEDDDIPF